MAAAGPELCPHCQRPFKRLRAHLPHCKAAPPAAPGTHPRPAPGGAAPPAPSAAPATGRGSAARQTPAGAPGSALETSPQPSPAIGSVSEPTAAPRPAPGTGRGSGARQNPASAPGSALGTSPQPSPATGSVPEPTPAPGPRLASGSGRGAAPAAPRSGSRAVRDVARSLDLHPEEVEDVPKKLQKGVKVVIEKHRAKVVREKEARSRAGAAGSRGEGTEPSPAPHKTARKSNSEETRGQGAVRSGTGSSKGEKRSLKATKALQEAPASRNSPGDLVQQEGRDKFTAGEEHLEVGVGSKSPMSALHPKNLHLSLTEAFGGHSQGTSKNELSSRKGVAEPFLNPGRAPELALLHTPQIQPTCSSQASGRSAKGLEWFPDLYPDYEGLRIFPGKRFQQDVRITEETPRGGLALGQQGPLSERPLLEVRLGELHTWISTCNFSPQGLLGAVQRAWSSYCAKYIHVKQGGPAGISMLLAGYFLLSYGWNYQHLKRHRWRKYH